MSFLLLIGANDEGTSRENKAKEPPDKVDDPMNGAGSNEKELHKFSVNMPGK